MASGTDWSIPIPNWNSRWREEIINQNSIWSSFVVVRFLTSTIRTPPVRNCLSFTNWLRSSTVCDLMNFLCFFRNFWNNISLRVWEFQVPKSITVQQKVQKYNITSSRIILKIEWKPFNLALDSTLFLN